MTTPTPIDLSTYIVVSICFSCNNSCSICMLGSLKHQLPGLDFGRFQRLVHGIAREGRYSNLILSGAEVTTLDDLIAYVRFARSLSWFKRIQIQTNGRRLQDREYLQNLVDGGVDEFFVSVHGVEAVHDTITRSPGSFRETVEGLQNLQGCGANVITNTVVTRANLQGIPDLARVLADFATSEIHLWNFFPMEQVDSRGLVVRLADVLALVPRLDAAVRSTGKALVLKSFPECLAIEPPLFLDSLFPETLLPERFWMRFGENRFGQCPHRQVCASQTCWGLSSAYIHAYGQEEKLLSPRR